MGSDFRSLNDFLADAILATNKSFPFNLAATTDNLAFVSFETESTLPVFTEVALFFIIHSKTSTCDSFDALNTKVN